MKRREILAATPACLWLAGHPQDLLARVDVGGMFGAAKDALNAASLSDEDVRRYASQMALHMDRQARVAPPGHNYTKRLTALTQGTQVEQGLKLNYKVYLTQEVNAFAMADGTIRFYSGLMDVMTDDEIRYVIGHEIGHVKHGHSKKRMQTALATSATQKAVAASGSKHAHLAESQLADLFVRVVRAQHSQDNEREADEYALQFMARKKYERKAAVSALEKLAKLSGGDSTSWLSTHPSPKERAERMRKQIV